MAEFKLGIQSWTFRNFKTLDELIGLLNKTGVSYVELYPGGQLPHENGKDVILAGLDKLKKAGITVESFGVCGFSKDENMNRKAFEFAKIAGIKAISADIDPEAISLAENLSQEYNIKLAIHNHGRNHRYGKIEQLKDIFEKTGANIGLCLDTAWMLDAGTDPVQAARMFGERLYGVHLKDFIFAADGKPQDVVLGEGGLKLNKFFQTLESLDFDGYLSIEYEGEPENPLPKVIECVNRVHQVLGK
ncbi:sugar phosphate isomerase/epimerase [Candidatus Desantisbacteria bacterium CG07_land_8_20_14_0_80_39_15]|uniref:Sugar phosphate isomerase/epimerase n=1 Tax=Candidatus Desantisbacteria bacterium CG07_land_8_20_14_0_80_39_15 TaxID=1974549 RepID=A0A2M6ZIJ9_9BACT|nr:MAG: sugar phosphate isomerase/epimerase [Candidatus Desantisbacteria bacterium CG07_land_8_20_14_0_80_39_15]